MIDIFKGYRYDSLSLTRLFSGFCRQIASLHHKVWIVGFGSEVGHVLRIEHLSSKTNWGG